MTCWCSTSSLAKRSRDISLNAFANLGYADCRFLKTVRVGDTLTATSEVIGLKQNSIGKTGVVYVRTNGHNQDGDVVLTYAPLGHGQEARRSRASARNRRAGVAGSGGRFRPVGRGAGVRSDAYNDALAGSPYRWSDYEVGEKIDHVDGATVEEAEHQIATRLYQNTAKVHFNQHAEQNSRFGRRLVYGGVVISIARALSFNGLGNAFHVAAINGGSHVAPLFAGDTVYAWSEILDKSDVATRTDVGALRVRMVGLKNRDASGFPLTGDDGKPAEGVVLNLDAWLVLPK
jgi:2-methylfumaryl-CoA hydratase